ncbi:Cell division protein FtsP [Rhynchospora pubera]|uniref:Cell division protein FtsP n=1 Tax=Rhynchospora pubera TaxID=906938 RepID=A0AAV8DEX3_9POAL|nr:Cell division protein FtsP [Rhynchospora pubera]
MGRNALFSCILSLALLVQCRGFVLVHGDDGRNLFIPKKLEMFVDELPDMPKLQGYHFKDGERFAGNLSIGMYDTTWKFHRDLPATRVFAYGLTRETATVPGPTIEAIKGIPTYITWTNHLPSRHFLPWDPTITTAKSISGVPAVVHLHGGVQPPSSDGNSMAWFTAGFSDTGPQFSSPVYFYPNFQPPGNLWYHDHAMGLTRVNILAGLFGIYRIMSPQETSLRLPSGPLFDRHLVLFDRDFRTDGSLYMNNTGCNPSIHPQWQPEYFGTAIIVNGKAWPYLRVRRRRYRFRILNASNARFFSLSFSDGTKFIHVASDSVYLPKPVQTRKFLLAPSEIADVIVDFSESASDSVILLNDAPFPYPSGDPTDEMNGKVMTFLIGRSKEKDMSHVPSTLMKYPRPQSSQVAAKRHIIMYEYESKTGDPTHLYLNAKSFMDPVTEMPREGTDEIWEVVNLTDDNHPLHVHLGVVTVLGAQTLADVDKFKECMMKKNDVKACNLTEHVTRKKHGVVRHERGWKNVVKIWPGNLTRILVRFSPLDENKFPFDPTAEPGYVYHCHILDHEDNEMMRPFKIVP